MALNTTMDDACCASSNDTCSCGEIVAAGSVYTAGCTVGEDPVTDCSMAVICCPIQTYVAGFCPAEALQYGTLFPELVGVY